MKTVHFSREHALIKNYITKSSSPSSPHLLYERLNFLIGKWTAVLFLCSCPSSHLGLFRALPEFTAKESSRLTGLITEWQKQWKRPFSISFFLLIAGEINHPCGLVLTRSLPLPLAFFLSTNHAPLLCGGNKCLKCKHTRHPLLPPAVHSLGVGRWLKGHFAVQERLCQQVENNRWGGPWCPGVGVFFRNRLNKVRVIFEEPCKIMLLT